MKAFIKIILLDVWFCIRSDFFYDANFTAPIDQRWVRLS